jgi:23S rRNA (uracil1939-C5)-methyltransferase
MQKNGEYIGEVSALGSEGEGIIYLDGYVIFVPGCLAGERVSFKVLKVKGNVAYGKLTEVHTLSGDRTTPVCPVYEKCGGCQLQHMSYSAQLEFKRQSVENCLKKIGGLNAEVQPAVAGEKQYYYRNKLALPIGRDAAGNNAVGFYAPRSHRIVPISACPLQQEWTTGVISAVYEFMKVSGYCGYDEEKKVGELRQIVGREIKGKYIITIVATKKIKLSSLEKLLEKVLEKFTLLLNINAGDGNVIFGKEWHICRGEGFFVGEDEGIKFKAGANTFLQVNDDVRAKLYAATVAAATDKNAVALDLYSGGGMLTAMLAKNCKAAYGIEIVPEAVACADELKEMNGLSDKMFNICGAVEKNIRAVFERTQGLERVIVCDPPRKGMERSVVKEILQSGADKVVLISCNPSTLARDLGLLCGSLKEDGAQLVKNPEYNADNNLAYNSDNASNPSNSCNSDNACNPTHTNSNSAGSDGVVGACAGSGYAVGSCAAGGFYNIVSITPFDMFPQTKHVETLVVLCRK